MRFWDSSAVVPLLVSEPMSSEAIAWLEEDPQMVVWWGTPVECCSALARVEREGGLDSDVLVEAGRRLQDLQRAWHEVQPAGFLRETAIRMLRVHPLRSMDALQLAAATIVAENRPSLLDFVCLDRRLAVAAQREGFRVIAA